MTISIDFPNELEKALNQRAQQVGKKPEDVIIDIVAKELETATTEKPLSEREKIRAVLKKAGMLSELSPELRERYVTPHSREERAAILKELQQLSFSPTFSEMIIADRKSQG